MRVVVDTNVFISAALKRTSTPAQALSLARQRGTLLKSVATEHQLLEVMARPALSRLIAPAATAWIIETIALAEQVKIVGRVAACRDPTDDKFLELAVNGAADFLLSGDGDLLVMGSFHDIPILNPADFLAMIAGSA